MKNASLQAISSLIIALFAGCAAAPETEDPELGVESVQLALTAIPAGTSCIRVTTLAGGRSFAQDFAVTGGSSGLTAMVRGLPANQALMISADAYAVACASITPTTRSEER